MVGVPFASRYLKIAMKRQHPAQQELPPFHTPRLPTARCDPRAGAMATPPGMNVSDLPSTTSLAMHSRDAAPPAPQAPSPKQTHAP